MARHQTSNQILSIFVSMLHCLINQISQLFKVSYIKLNVIKVTKANYCILTHLTKNGYQESTLLRHSPRHCETHEEGWNVVPYTHRACIQAGETDQRNRKAQ